MCAQASVVHQTKRVSVGYLTLDTLFLSRTISWMTGLLYGMLTLLRSMFPAAMMPAVEGSAKGGKGPTEVVGPGRPGNVGAPFRYDTSTSRYMFRPASNGV